MFQAEESFEKFGKQVCEVIPKQYDRLIEELKVNDPELAEKVKKLRTELTHLKEDLIKLYEELKKPILERFNEVKDEVISKTKPIVKRWTPLVKDFEVSDEVDAVACWVTFLKLSCRVWGGGVIIFYYKSVL